MSSVSGGSNWWAGSRPPSAQDVLNNRPSQNNTPARRRFSSLDPVGNGSISELQARSVSRHFTREAGSLRSALNDLRSVAGDASAINEQKDALRRMVNTYNDMLSASAQVGGQGINRLEQELVGVVRDFRSQLGRAGITMDRDGFMRINEGRLRSAVERGEIGRIVNDSGGRSFVNSLSRMADAISREPDGFLNTVREVRPRTGLFNSRR